MVRYLDPEENPEGAMPQRKRRTSPGERLAKNRERNAALTGDAAIDAAREAALRQLDSRARSEQELRKAITSRGFAEDVADEVIGRLARVGLVDDQALGESLARSIFATQGAVGRALRQKLERRGIPRDIIDQAVEAVDNEAAADRAFDMASRKSRWRPGDDPDAERRRLASMLARKGYSSGLCFDVARRVVAERQDAVAQVPADRDWHAESA